MRLEPADSRSWSEGGSDYRVLPVVVCRVRVHDRVVSITADIAPLKEIQKFIWSQGDYEQLAREGQPAAENLVEACAVAPGRRVLDVGAGKGNLAIAAARRGARMVATDIAPRMIELGRARSAARGWRSS